MTTSKICSKRPALGENYRFFLAYFQTILAKIMWKPNFSNANINIETFFHEINLSPAAPYSMLFLAFKF